MAKKEKPRFKKDLSRNTITDRDELLRVYGANSAVLEYVARDIAQLDAGLTAGCRRIFYASSVAEDINGDEVYAWITREQAKVMAEVFKDKSITKLELQYTTWEDGAFWDFVSALRTANSKVEKFKLNCHSGDEFTRDQAYCLAELVPVWGIKELTIRNNEFLPEALDELAMRLEKSDYRELTKLNLLAQDPMQFNGARGPTHPGLQAVVKRNKAAK